MNENEKKPFDPQVFLSKVNGGKTVTEYREGKAIFKQGEPATAVFFLQSGRATITVLSEQGKEAVVAYLRDGEFFGEGSLTGQTVRLATVTAVTTCLVTYIPKPLVISMLHDEPVFAEMFIAHLLARTVRVEADLVDQLFNSSEKRLARTLLLLANFGKETAPEPVLPKISQETLAEMVGTTRSRVSAFMNKFRRLGLIEYNGQIRVHRSLLSAVLHEIPEVDKSKAR